MKIEASKCTYPLPHDLYRIDTVKIDGYYLTQLPTREVANFRADFISRPTVFAIFPENGPGEQKVIRVWPTPDNDYDMPISYFTAPKEA